MKDSTHKKQLILEKDLQELERKVEEARKQMKSYPKRYEIHGSNAGKQTKYTLYLSNRSDAFSY